MFYFQKRSASALPGRDGNFAASLHQRSQPGRCDLQITSPHQLSDLVPVQLGKIQAKADPSPRSDICGEIISARIGIDEKSVFTRQYSAPQADDTIAVMVVHVIKENLFADQEGRMLSLVLPGCLRKGQADGAQPGITLPGIRSFLHAETLPGHGRTGGL